MNRSGRVNRYEEAAVNLASTFSVTWRAIRSKPNDAGPGRVYGQAYRGTRRFEAPRPTSPRRFLFWLHEAAHVVGPFFGDDPLSAYAAEVKAFAWAFRTYRKVLGEAAPSSLRRWVKRQLEVQYRLALDSVFALVERDEGGENGQP